MALIVMALTFALLPLLVRGIGELGLYLETTYFGQKIIKLADEYDF